jgi:transcription-repair coupling factor (superfamily II helicase)
VGFELFTDLLREAVGQLKGDALAGGERLEPEVKFPLDASIPEPYIPDLSERLLLYQRLALIDEYHEADEILDEMADRFGEPSEEVRNLVDIMRYRGLLRRFAIAKAELSGRRLVLWLTNRSPLDLSALLALAESQPQTYRLGKNLTWWVELSSEKLPQSSIYRITESLLEGVRQDRVASPVTEPKRARD